MIKENKKNNTILITVVLSMICILLLDAFNVPTKLNIYMDFSNFQIYFSAVITGLITFFAMLFVDEQSKKRWQQDGYLKLKLNASIDILKYANEIKTNYLENKYSKEKLLEYLNYDYSSLTEIQKRELFEFEIIFKKLKDGLNISELKRIDSYTSKELMPIMLNKYNLYDNDESFEKYSTNLYKSMKEIIENKIDLSDSKISTDSMYINSMFCSNPKDQEEFKEFINLYINFQFNLDKIIEFIQYKFNN